MPGHAAQAAPQQRWSADEGPHLRAAGVALRRAGALTRTEGTVTKGAVHLAQFAQVWGKHNGFTSPFITNKFGKFLANPANFAQILPMLFLSECFGLPHPFITPPFVRFQEPEHLSRSLIPGLRVS